MAHDGEGGPRQPFDQADPARSKVLVRKHSEAGRNQANYPENFRVSSPVSPDVPRVRLRGGASHEAEGWCGARGGGADRVGPPATRRRLGALSLGGDVRTMMVGADYATGPLVTGLSLSHSRGLGEYAGVAGGQVALIGDGPVPVAGLPGDRARHGVGLSMAMAASGTRGELVAGGAGGVALAFKADALWVGTSIAGVDGPAGRLKATAAAVTRFRTGLEGSRGHVAWRLPSGAGGRRCGGTRGASGSVRRPPDRRCATPCASSGWGCRRGGRPAGCRGRGALAVARGPRQWGARSGEFAPPTSSSGRVRAG